MTISKRQRYKSPALYLFTLQVACLVVAPFYFGGERLLAWGILGAFQSIILIVNILFLPITSLHLREDFRIMIACRLMVVPFAWAIIQIVPLPAHIFENGIWTAVSENFEFEITRTISISPDESYLTILKILIVLTALYNSYKIALVYRVERLILSAISVIGAIYAGIGLYWRFEYPINHIWLTIPAYFGNVVSTFVNRNSFAMYLGLCSHANLVILIQLCRPSANSISRRNETLAFLQNKFPQILIFLALYLVQIIALLLSGSRAGALTVLVAQVTLISFVFMKKSARTVTTIAMIISIIPLMSLIHSNYSGILDARSSSLDLSMSSRIALYNEVWSTISDRYLTGYGLGAFEQAFRFHKSIDFDPAGIWLRAHNVYLELMLALGVPAALCALSAFVLVSITIFKPVFMRHLHGIHLATAAAIISVALHSLFDFGVQAGANAVTFSTLIGTAIGLSRNKQYRSNLI